MRGCGAGSAGVRARGGAQGVARSAVTMAKSKAKQSPGASRATQLESGPSPKQHARGSCVEPRGSRTGWDEGTFRGRPPSGPEPES